MKKVYCNECGQELKTGDWPWCPHERVKPTPSFIPYIDENIAEKPVYITSAHQRFKLMEKGDLDMKRHPETKRITHRKMFFLGNRF